MRKRELNGWNVNEYQLKYHHHHILLRGENDSHRVIETRETRRKCASVATDGKMCNNSNQTASCRVFSGIPIS